MKTLSFHDLQTGYRNHEPLLMLDSEKDGVTLKSGLNLLVAPNGFGKSTLLKTLSGKLPAIKGDARLEGHRVRPQQDVVYFSEYLSFPKFVYPAEWIEFVSGKEFSAEARDWFGRLRLDALSKSYLGRMSQGERRKVNWVASHLSDHSLVLMDEPFEGLDILALPAAMELLQDWRERGRVVILVSHRLADLIEIADDILVIDRGRLRSIRQAPEGEWTSKSLRRYLIDFYSEAVSRK